ncbi:DUF3016 domain-containing protein [Catenovulum sediminis]|uniref:DUF3016 domain-containing protein n=1 Tax=Catenovulum sediminis TaxID=1740262 RepID=A0ABV1RNS9_9ALTE|nr:DUF3016 domain-containing protein [Catenovulum sediminis]
MIRLLKYCLTSLVLCYSQMAHAGSVEVTWSDPDEYTDIKPSSMHSRKSFQEHTFAQFEKYLNWLAEKKLPKDYVLKLTVTDLDLAGHVWWYGSSMEDVRIIKAPYIPRMSFGYQLLDDKKQVVKSGEEKLKHMSMSQHTILPVNMDNFKFEFNMLHRWFERDLLAEAQSSKT